MVKFNIQVIAIIVLINTLFVTKVLAQEEEVKNYALTLDEVTQLALENNFDIQLAQYDVWIARTQLGVEESIYDTILNAQSRYQKNESKRTTTILGSEVVDNDYDLGLSKKTPLGSTLGVELFNNRNKTDSAFSTSPLTHESILKFSVKQELGRNFFGLQDRGNIKITQIDIENAQYLSLDNIEDDILEVQNAYWELATAKKIVAIEEDMLEQAKRLYDLHQEKIKDGLVELPETIASEANYRERINELILAQEVYQRRVNVLKLKLNIVEDDVRITPVDDLIVPQAKEELAFSLKEAFQNRNDYKGKINEIRKRKLDLSMKKNNLWPEINLTASLARNGLGDHFSDSINNTTDENHPNFIAGLSVEFPLENTKARAQLSEAKLLDARTLLESKLLEREITIAIIDQVNNCNVLQEVAFNSDEIAQLQISKLQEEEKRFKWGRSDTDTIIRFQEDAIAARRRSVLAKSNYRKSLVELRRRESTLLSQYWEREL